MISITCKCDKCGKTWDGLDPSGGQLWQLSIQLRCVRSNGQASASAYAAPFDAKPIQWCRTCMECHGLLPTDVDEPKVVIDDPEKHVADLLRQLLIAAGCAASDEQESPE